MDYISEVFLFWVMKPIAELALIAVVLLVIVAAFAVKELTAFLRQSRCKHENLREDRSCTAWCRKCGKNLGFIGNLR